MLIKCLFVFLFTEIVVAYIKPDNYFYFFLDGDHIIFLISDGCLLEIIKNPGMKYQNQFMFVIKFDNYIYLVPFVINKNEIFLKTIIPGRKATEKYIGGKNNENR